MTCKNVQRAQKAQCGDTSTRCTGSVAAEFAIVAPMLALLAAGIADFGMLATRTSAGRSDTYWRGVRTMAPR
jgi:hypothetical protein